MFIKQEQRSWLTIQCAHGHTAKQFHEDLVEAYEETALPYSPVARCVRAFNDRYECVADVARPRRQSVSDGQVQVVAGL